MNNIAKMPTYLTVDEYLKGCQSPETSLSLFFCICCLKNVYEDALCLVPALRSAGYSISSARAVPLCTLIDNVLTPATLIDDYNPNNDDFRI